MLSGEATNTKLIVFGLTRSGLEPTIYGALERSTPTITPQMRLNQIVIQCTRQTQVSRKGTIPIQRKKKQAKKKKKKT